MRKFLKDYLTFTRSETRVIIILSVLLFFILLIRLIIGTSNPESYVPDESELRIINEFIASNEIVEKDPEKYIESKTRIYYDKLKKFNPNIVKISELHNMGFPERVISNLSKYRESGGYFGIPGDMKRIYGLTDSAYNLILPYINIPAEQFLIEKSQLTYKKPELININTADSIQLISLKGIGPGFASRIIKYRNRLGGFIKPEQLLEVYGLGPDNYNLFKDRIIINHDDIRKIPINNITFPELIKHPYINREMAASIIKYRDFRGKITDFQELYKFNVIDKEELEKISSYLSIPEE